MGDHPQPVVGRLTTGILRYNPRVMRRLRSPVILALAVGTIAAADPTFVISDVTLIDGTGALPQSHVDVIVRAGRIADVLPSDPSRAGSADLTLNGAGRYAIPGLFDAHVHLSPSRWEQRTEQLRRLLHGGVTSVYDVAGDVRQTSDFARAVIAGDIEGPTIDYCTLMAGPAFFSDPRVVGSSRGYTSGDAPWNRAITPETDLAQAVAEAKGSGASAIKLYAALDATAVQRIAAEAHRQGMRLVAHSTVFPAKPSDLVAAGVNVLAHAAYLVWEGSPPNPDFTKRAVGDFEHVKPDAPEIERLLLSMRDRDVALNPTLWIFTDGPASHDEQSAARKAWMNAVTQRASELGVKIVAGTDSLFDPPDPLPTIHREIEVLVSGARLTPMQAIVAATGNAASAIGVQDRRGTIDRGKEADILLLDADPLEDIRNTRKLRSVIQHGRIVFSAEQP
jgi:imidazolonepropionase-like amidohydrolase